MLEGEWQAVLTSISFASNINNAKSNLIVVYVNSDAEVNAPHQRSRHFKKIRKGIYNSLDQLMKEIVRIAHLKQVDFSFYRKTHKLALEFGAKEGLSFENEEVPIILGFKDIKEIPRDGYIRIGYKSDKVLNRHESDFPVDITSGSQLIFVYINIIGYQSIGDVRARVFEIMESGRRLRNGSINNVTPIHHKTFRILDYKPILSYNIQNIKVELRIEAGKLVPLTGTGNVIVSLKLQKIMWNGSLLQ